MGGGLLSADHEPGSDALIPIWNLCPAQLTEFSSEKPLDLKLGTSPRENAAIPAAAYGREERELSSRLLMSFKNLSFP